MVSLTTSHNHGEKPVTGPQIHGSGCEFDVLSPHYGSSLATSQHIVGSWRTMPTIDKTSYK